MIQDRRDFLKSLPVTTSVAAGLVRALPQEVPEKKPPPPEKPERQEKPEPEIPAKKKPDPFLSGNFAPVKKELEPTALEVTGTLPKELTGFYVRNGPNPQFPPLGTYTWMDGDAMLHGVRFRDGKATYSNRWVRTHVWNAEHGAGEALFGGMLDPPSVTRVPPHIARNASRANTSIVYHHKKLLTLWEGDKPYAVSPTDLKTEGRYDFRGQLIYNFCSHPKVDPKTGEMLFFGAGVTVPYVKYGICDERGVLTYQTPIEIPEPVLMHDFAITEKHTVFCDLPMVFSMAKLRAGANPWTFRADRPARFGVMARKGTSAKIKWFETDPCYFFHTFGAFEEKGEIVIVASRYDRFPTGMIGFYEEAKDGKRVADAAYAHRFRLNLETGKVASEALDDVPAEWSRIDERRQGRPFRYGYAMRGPMDGLIQYDFAKGKKKIHIHGKGRRGGEGLFVPHPEKKAENAGWVLCYVHDEGSHKTDLVVIDAEDFEAKPIARLRMPQRVPYGFHGTWIPGAELG